VNIDVQVPPFETTVFRSFLCGREVFSPLLPKFKEEKILYPSGVLQPELGSVPHRCTFARFSSPTFPFFLLEKGEFPPFR